MRLLLVSLLVVAVAVCLAWLVPAGPPAATDPANIDTSDASARSRTGPLLVGRGTPSVPRPRETKRAVSDVGPPGIAPSVLIGTPVTPQYNGHASGAEMPRAPGPVRALAGDDADVVPVVSRAAFLATGLGGSATGPGSASSEPWWQAWRGRHGSGDALVVALARDDAEIASRAEEPEPLVTAILGTVVSGEGEPVMGAAVVVYSAFYERHLAYGHRIREVGRVTTDVEGRFELRPISLDTVHFGSNGEVVLSIAAEGFGDIVTRRLANIQPDVDNDLGRFVLTPQAVTLQGRLIDRKGEPVPDAVVRVSGSLEPTLYDKKERMVFLRNCPTATTDEDGRYALSGFAPDAHFISVHVNIDSPWTESRKLHAGTNTLDLTIRAGGSVRGMVVDEAGEPLAAAIVAGGENYTHSLADGSFWLDNVAPGPFTVWVSHHRYRTVRIENVAAVTEALDVQMTELLPRLTLHVIAGAEAEVAPIIAVDWTWPEGQLPNPAVPASPYWHSPTGEYAIPIPERAQTAIISAEHYVPHPIDLNTREDGLQEIHLREPEIPSPPEAPSDE